MRENDEKSTSIDIIALSDHAHVQYVYHKTKFQVLPVNLYRHLSLLLCLNLSTSCSESIPALSALDFT